MADFNSPEEIQQYLDDTARVFGKTSQQYVDALKDARVGIQGYTANLKATMAQLGTSFKQMGKAVYDGKQGASTYNETLGKGADAVAAYAMKFGPAGVALGAFTKAVTAFATASLKQSDALFESFQKISRTGTVGAGAMSEVFDNMLKFGYTVDQLGNLGDLLAKNSKNFGLFFQSALSGSRAFGNVATQLQNSPLRQQFFNLGLSVDDINDGIAGYVVQQGKLGQIQGRTVGQLADGAEAYIKELDILTKLTGLSRQEQEDAREQALQIESFYAGLADLSPKAQEQALQAFTMAYAKGGPKAASEMASSFNGVITGATDLLLTTGGANMQAFSKDFFAKGGTAAQSFDLLKSSISPGMIELTKNLNQVGAGFGLNLRTINMLTKDGIDPMTKIMDQLTDEQYKQITGMDKATAAQSKIRDNQIKSSQNLQEFVNLGVNPATQALKLLTDAVEYLTSFIPGAGRAAQRRKDAAATAAGTTTANQDNINTVAAGGTGAAGPAGEGPTGTMGLKLKAGAEKGGKSSDALYAVAQQVAEKLGDSYKYFSGFNDVRSGDSKHNSGRAFDIVMNDPNGYESALSMIKGMPGVSFAQYERAGQRNPNGSIASGDHIHTEVSAAEGAILSGPTSGYKPNLTMHGTEAVIPLNSTAGQSAISGQDNSIMAAQLDRLDELVSVMKSQLSVSTKIMQYSS